MPNQILLRHLTRKLRPGTLAGFWQGRYTLQPWNEVANSAYSQQPVPQGQTWDAGADFGFAAHRHITNPSTGLDSIYQKHVWSRLGTAEPPEGSDTDGQAQAKALAAAAAFVTLQPAAAAAATQEDQKDERCKAGSLSLPDPLKPVAVPAVIRPFTAETSLDSQEAADTDAVMTVLSTGLSTIPEEPEEASQAASEASTPPAAHSAAAERQGSHSCEALPAADAASDRAEAGPKATGVTASASQTGQLSNSKAAAGACRPSTAVHGEVAPARQMSAGLPAASALLHCHAAALPAGCGPEGSAQHADRVLAKQLMPLPVLTPLETAHASRRDPQALLSAAMHAPHAVPPAQDGPPATACDSEHAEAAVARPDLMSSSRKAEHGAAGKPHVHSIPAVALPGLSCTQAVPSHPGQVSMAIPAVAFPLGSIHHLSQPRPGRFAGEALVSRPSTAAVASEVGPWASQIPVPSAVGGGQAMPTAVHSQQPKVVRAAASAPANVAERSASDAVWPVLAALKHLLDAGSMRVSGYLPGLVVAQGEVCGRAVYTYYVHTDSIAPSSQPSACRAICSMMDAAVAVGSPVVSIHGSCNPFNTPKHSATHPAAAAELADWMPAVQRHMDTSGVVPHLAVSQGRMSTVSSLLASTSDYSFFQPESRNPCGTGECDQDSNSSSQLGSRSGSRDSGHHQDEGSASSGALCCEQGNAQQASSSVACSTVEEALHRARQLLAMLPSSNSAPAPKVPCHDPPWRACSGLQEIQSPLDLCTRLADAGLVAGSWAAPGTAVCFGRLDCATVGFVAMPCSAVVPGIYSRRSLAQVIKAVRFCSAFSLPIISLLLPHQHEAAAEGLTGICDLANLIFAYSEAAVPKLAVVNGPEAIFAGKCLKLDPMLTWTSNSSKGPTKQKVLPEARGANGALGPTLHCRSISPEDTRLELCRALGPLLGSRLVAVPKRKHALLPKVY